MATIVNIANGETGLSARQKLNILADLYNQVAISNGAYVFQRIDASKIQSATPSGLFLRDDGTWQAVSGSQNLAQVLAVDNKTNGIPLTSNNGFAYINISNFNSRLHFSDGININGHCFISHSLLGLNWSDGIDYGNSNINVLNSEIQHTQKITLNAPLIYVQNATASKLAVFDASKNLVSGTKSESDLIADITAAQVNSEAYADGLFATIMGGVPALAYDTIKELSDEAISIVASLGNRLRVDTNTQGLSLLEKTNAKTNIGLNLVDNTADIDKVISTLAQASFDTKVNGALGTTANQIAVTTGSNNEVESSNSFTWDNVNKVFKTGSQASVGVEVGVQLLPDNTCTIPFTISSQGNGDAATFIHLLEATPTDFNYTILKSGGITTFNSPDILSFNLTNYPGQVLSIDVNRLMLNLPLRLVNGSDPVTPDEGYVWGNSNRLKHYINSTSEIIAYLSDISGVVLINTTAILNFGSEETDSVILTVLDSTLTNANFKAITFMPIETPETSLNDFHLNAVSFNIENIIDGVSFDIRATALNEASGNYTIKYILTI
jgi:hypothetical protein